MNDIAIIIKNLNLMWKSLDGECIINDSDSTNYLKVIFKEGKLWIEGLFSDFKDHILNFKFLSDQTVLKKIIEVLE